MRTLAIIFILLVSPLIFWRCDSLDREEPIPSYIYIPSVSLNIADPDNEGSGSHKIQDVWVTVGNSYLGAYELPAMIPVLETGNQRILIRAGVLENGIAATRISYPFYTEFETTIDLREKEIDTIKPSYSYDAANTKFAWIEDFESGFISLEPTSYNTAPFGITTHPDSVFEGTGSLHITLKDTTDYLELNTLSTFVLPRGEPVWIEVNYKTDAPVEFGFLSFTGSGAIKQFVAGVNPSTEWKKIYFNFTNLVSQQPSLNTFRFYIESLKPNDKTAAHILLDNIKLLHRE